MDYVPEEVKDLWREVALEFNSAAGGFGSYCKLTFSIGIRPSNEIMTDTVSQKFRYMPAPGGFSSPNQVKTYEETSFPSASGYYQAESHKTIEGRVYGAKSELIKEFETIGSIQAGQNVWKFICDKRHIPDIMKASFATFYSGSSKEYRTKLLKPPSSYGLAADVNCISYWTEA